MTLLPPATLSLKEMRTEIQGQQRCEGMMKPLWRKGAWVYCDTGVQGQGTQFRAPTPKLRDFRGPWFLKQMN